MPLTLRNVDDIRQSLDKYKKTNRNCKADTKAITAMVNEYHGLKKQLEISEEKNLKLRQNNYSLENQMNNLSEALEPFFKRFK